MAVESIPEMRILETERILQWPVTREEFENLLLVLGNKYRVGYTLTESRNVSTFSGKPRAVAYSSEFKGAISKKDRTAGVFFSTRGPDSLADKIRYSPLDYNTCTRIRENPFANNEIDLIHEINKDIDSYFTTHLRPPMRLSV